jgi:hypothetical protein
MSTNVKIEIDERTADVLHARAAELGVTVSELVAELATLDSEPIAVDSDEIAELDRRWKKIEAGQPTIPHERRSVAAHVGHAAIPPVAGSIDLDWSDDALADLDRFAAFL